MTTSDILKSIKHNKINKASGEDQILSKLVKTAGEFLSEHITDTINSCFNKSTLPDQAERASYITSHEPHMILFTRV